MRLRAPLSFVCTFIFGQLFDRKRRFEDSFVPLRENREDASGGCDAAAIWHLVVCPPRQPPVRGSRRGREQLVRRFEAGGRGSVLDAWLGLARLGPPSVDQTIPGRRTECRIKQWQKLPCRAGDANPKHKPLPLLAPASPRRERSGARLAPGKINTARPCRLGLGAGTLAGPSLWRTGRRCFAC